MKTVDARGFSCPEPVLMAKRGMKDADALTILVDTHVSKENVTRFLQNEEFTVTSNDRGDHFEILAKK